MTSSMETISHSAVGNLPRLVFSTKAVIFQRRTHADYSSLTIDRDVQNDLVRQLLLYEIWRYLRASANKFRRSDSLRMELGLPSWRSFKAPRAARELTVESCFSAARVEDLASVAHSCKRSTFSLRFHFVRVRREAYPAFLGRLKMSGGGGAAPKGGKGDKDNTVAQVTGAVIASGVVWSLYKSFRGRNAVEKEPAETSSHVTPPSTSRARLDKHYQVVKGDTLWSISRRYGVTVGDVRDANGIPNVDYIYPGEKLVIPQ